MKPMRRAVDLRIRSTQDAAGGLFMIVLASLALFLARELPSGTLSQMGPGMLPKAFAVICMALGFLLVLQSWRYEGEGLASWSWRNIAQVLGAACVFGLTIRGFQVGPLDVPALGMLVSSPLLLLIAGFAATDARPKELLLFTIGMTTACSLLFKYALSLPIPLAPWLLGI